jgi:uncharacterized membrane-anchored protein
MKKTNRKILILNGITRVEFHEKDIAIVQEDSIVILDHEDIESIIEELTFDQKMIN